MYDYCSFWNCGMFKMRFNFRWEDERCESTLCLHDQKLAKIYKGIGADGKPYAQCEYNSIGLYGVTDIFEDELTSDIKKEIEETILYEAKKELNQYIGKDVIVIDADRDSYTGKFGNNGNNQLDHGWQEGGCYFVDEGDDGIMFLLNPLSIRCIVRTGRENND